MWCGPFARDSLCKEREYIYIQCMVEGTSFHCYSASSHSKGVSILKKKKLSIWTVRPS